MTARPAVPFVDLAAQQTEIAPEVQRGFAEVFAATAFVGGKDVAAFEREYADFLGVAHCVGVANGTDAIEFALRALGIGPGDEVVLPTNTFVATAEAVLRAGARPVLADVDDDYLLLDPAAAAAAVTEGTRAVVPVHLYGQAAPVAEIVAACRGDLFVVEDAAQSQGATRAGRATGGLGHIAATSFYPGKNLGAAGDAGAVLTDDAELARRVRLLGSHGSERKYVHEALGFNSRLDTLQAVVLRAKLARLASWNDARRVAAARYEAMMISAGLVGGDSAGGDGPVRLPRVAPGNEHVWHLYVVRVPAVVRDVVLGRLAESGVAAGIHYPVPVHLHSGMSDLGYSRGDFPVAERAADEILSLPMYPHITEADQQRVVDELVRALA